MTFECGHNSAAGVGKVCLECHLKGVIPVKMRKPKEKGQMGRPKIYLDSEARHKETVAKWHAEHAEERKVYTRLYNRKRNKIAAAARKGGCFAIYKEGCWLNDNDIFGSWGWLRIFESEQTAIKFAKKYDAVYIAIQACERKMLTEYAAMQKRAREYEIKTQVGVI